MRADGKLGQLGVDRVDDEEAHAGGALPGLERLHDLLVRDLSAADEDRARLIAAVVDADRAAEVADRVRARAERRAHLHARLVLGQLERHRARDAEEAFELAVDLADLLEDARVWPDGEVQLGLGERARDRRGARRLERGREEAVELGAAEELDAGKDPERRRAPPHVVRAAACVRVGERERAQHVRDEVEEHLALLKLARALAAEDIVEELLDLATRRHLAELLRERARARPRRHELAPELHVLKQRVAPPCVDVARERHDLGERHVAEVDRAARHKGRIVRRADAVLLAARQHPEAVDVWNREAERAREDARPAAARVERVALALAVPDAAAHDVWLAVARALVREGRVQLSHKVIVGEIARDDERDVVPRETVGDNALVVAPAELRLLLDGKREAEMRELALAAGVSGSAHVRLARDMPASPVDDAPVRCGSQIARAVRAVEHRALQLETAREQVEQRGLVLGHHVERTVIHGYRRGRGLDWQDAHADAGCGQRLDVERGGGSARSLRGVLGLAQMSAKEVAADLRALSQFVSRGAHVAHDAHAARLRAFGAALAADEQLKALLKDEAARVRRAAAGELLVHPEQKRVERLQLRRSRLVAVLRRVMPDRARPLHGRQILPGPRS